MRESGAAQTDFGSKGDFLICDKECSSTHLLLENNIPIDIHAMDLENRFGQIDSDCHNFHRTVPSSVGSQQRQHGTLRCRWVEPSTPSV